MNLKTATLHPSGERLRSSFPRLHRDRGLDFTWTDHHEKGVWSVRSCYSLHGFPGLSVPEVSEAWPKTSSHPHITHIKKWEQFSKSIY